MRNKHFYFGFGMNTDPEQMALRTGKPKALGHATLEGFKFRFAIHADVVRSPEHQVEGVLWKINNTQLSQLDSREGYPYYYNRSLLPVKHNGKVYRAWVYWMNDGHDEQLPSEGYLSMLRRGYTHFNVPQEQIQIALSEAAEAENSYFSNKGRMHDYKDTYYGSTGQWKNLLC